MIVEELKSNREWENFLEASPEGTFYHSLKWKKVIQDTFSLSPLYLTLKDENGALLGICPGFIQNSNFFRTYYSTPFSDYGAPLIKESCTATLNECFQGILSFLYENGITYAKFRLKNWLQKTRKFLQSVPSYYLENNTGVMEIDLKAKSSEVLWKQVFSTNVRKKLRKIEKNGLHAYAAKSKSDLKEFYELYSKNLLRIGGFPHSYKFMENLWDDLHPENLRLWMVEKGQKYAGAINFKYGKKTFCTYVGYDKELCSKYTILRYLQWKEIELGEKEGCNCFSLGLTPSNPYDIHFIEKTRVGATFYETPVIRYPLCPLGDILTLGRDKAYQIWKKFRGFLPKYCSVCLENKLSEF